MELNSKIAEIITGGKCNIKWNADGISIDTRTIKKGNLFVALTGKNFNAHDFLKEAFLNGAAAAVVNKIYLKEEHKEYPLLIVEDTEKALVDIAKKARDDFKGSVIAVTGSIGKTTTKEMLKLGLSGVTTVYANKGNLNNNIGMPLSLANLKNCYQVAIFELGMNKSKEIEYLSKILRPNIAIITEISNTHSKFFNSLKEIFLAKMEIIKGLISPKILIFNANNPFFDEAKQISLEENINIYSFSNINNEYKVNAKEFVLLNSNIDTKLSNNSLYFTQDITANINNKIFTYNLPTLAKHKGLLSIIVLGIASILGFNVNKVITSFSHYKDMSGRGDLVEIKILPNKKFFMIDDSYNASPLSMKKSILMLKDINIENIKLRKIVVLGDMLELSNDILEHQKLKKYILEVNPNAVFTLGNIMQNLVKVLPKNMIAENYISSEKLYQKLISYLENNDIVLIKGSFSSGLHNIAYKLKNLNNYK